MTDIKEIREYAEAAYHIHPDWVLELIDRLEAAEKDAARWKFVLYRITHGVALGNTFSVWNNPEESTRRIDAAMKEMK